MKGHTHIIIALNAYFAYLTLFDQRFTLPSFLAAVLFALLPDIDTPYSTISQTSPITKVVSEKINVYLGHRGPLHSLFFRSVVTILLRVGYNSYYISFQTYVAGSIAYLSHVIADAFTPKGVPLFRPIDDRRVTICKRRGIRRALCVKTGGTKEEALEILLTFTLLALIGLYYGLYPRDLTAPSFVFPQRYGHDGR